MQFAGSVSCYRSWKLNGHLGQEKKNSEKKDDYHILHDIEF